MFLIDSGASHNYDSDALWKLFITMGTQCTDEEPDYIVNNYAGDERGGGRRSGKQDTINEE